MIIYKITNLINNKCYIGQTVGSLEKRWKRHCWQCTKSSNMPITYAINKYGKYNFKIEQIFECQTIEELNQKELYFANFYNTFSPNGYNLRAGDGKGSMSDETKRKISIANIGRKISEETREKLRISHLGYVVKEETKQKLSIINTGKILSNDHKEKIKNALLGRKLSEESKLKMSNKKLKFLYKLLSPAGEIIETNNLRDFCKKNNLNTGHMNSVANGKKLHYKGWKVISRTKISSDTHENLS